MESRDRVSIRPEGDPRKRTLAKSFASWPPWLMAGGLWGASRVRQLRVYAPCMVVCPSSSVASAACEPVGMVRVGMRCVVCGVQWEAAWRTGERMAMLDMTKSIAMLD